MSKAISQTEGCPPEVTFVGCIRHKDSGEPSGTAGPSLLKVKFNEKKMTAIATGASTPGLVADLLKTPFLWRSFTDNRE